MDINSVTVFLVQSGLSFAVLLLLIKWFIAPYLAAQPIRKAMLVLLAAHICHHVGLAVLVPGVVGADFPPNFAQIIAIGEPVMLVLAMLCMGAVRYRSALAWLLLWLFTIAGFAYNFIAGWVGISLGSALVDKLQAHWYVSVFYVPLLFMSHVLVLINLLKRGQELPEMNPIVGLVWIYWWCNRPFVAAFTEAVFGFGEDDLKVDGRAVVRKMDRLLRRINTPVFLQLVGTVALLPLYPPPVPFPKSSLMRFLYKLWYGIKSFFGHWHFLFSSREDRAKWIDRMYRTLIAAAPEQEEDMVKTIVTLTLFKSVLGIAYLEEQQVWNGLGYKPFHVREGITPPSGPNLADPPRTPSAKILHDNVKTPAQVAHKPSGKRTYCVIGSGAGGGVAARTLQERDPDARIILLELGSLVTNDQFTTRFMDSMASVFMNAAATLSQDMQFQFQQGRCVGGSTVVNNSVAFKPEGFWWEKNLKGRWQDLGVNLDYKDLYSQYDELEKLLHVAPVDQRITNQGGKTLREGFEQLHLHPPPITVKSNALDCIGCGRCNIGCQYDAKQSLMVTLIPDFVRNGGLLVPDAKVTNLEFSSLPQTSKDNQYEITAVDVEDADGNTVRIEADRFILAAGAYASTKLLWRSGFLGAIPGVRTVGKRFSVNAGAPVVGIFPETLDSFNGQQIGFALEVPEERMIIETAFVPPGIISLGVPAWGPEFQRRLKLVNNMAVGVPVFATLAYGEIKLGLLGDSGFVIDFSLIDEDWRRLEKGMKITAHAMFKMGAKEIFINRFNARSIQHENEIDEYLAGIGPSDFITVQSAHMQGGNVIAPNPYSGVVDENLKVHGVQNLWICDASVIPSPITINIALTVMALSRYAAVRIAALA